MSNEHDDRNTADSTDSKVTQDLIETLVDGRKGFADAADKLENDGHAQLAGQLRTFSEQRHRFADDLRQMARRYGDVVDDDGSAAAALHRGWMSLKDALTGSDADAVLNAAKKGEDHAVSEFEKALESDISAELRRTVDAQLADIRTARSTVEQMTTG